MSVRSAHLDTFVRDNLPPADQLPDFIHLDRLGYPQRLNAAVELLDRAVEYGSGARPVLLAPELRWSYEELLDKTNRIARVLVDDLAMVPGERVLLRSPNRPLMVACWLAVLKAGGIAVSTMPLLRAGELAVIIDKARVRLALCDARLTDELERAATATPGLERIVRFGDGGELESMMAARPPQFDPVDTAADDPCIIAFTSGTTGRPKGTVHFHRDLLATCDTFSRHVLRPDADDVFFGSPPLAFTFGLGGLVLFPLRAGASTLLIERVSPPELAAAIERWKPTIVFTSPTAYRALARLAAEHDLSSLRKGVSAGETLPLATYEAWLKATGMRLIDGLGSTEMLHIFLTAAGDDIRPGATGRPVPLYEARIIDDQGRAVAPGSAGRLAVRGPTGCRYLADERQREYVVDGWNVTGDTYVMDEDGYYWFQARNDDMIISAGYNIAGPEVEDALLTHPAVAECACVAWPDDERGHIVKAFVVLDPGVERRAGLARELQDHVKAAIAPYKYPRAVEFVDSLPKTETGKIQRFRLRQLAGAEGGRS